MMIVAQTQGDYIIKLKIGHVHTDWSMNALTLPKRISFSDFHNLISEQFTLELIKQYLHTYFDTADDYHFSAH